MGCPEWSTFYTPFLTFLPTGPPTADTLSLGERHIHTCIRTPYVPGVIHFFIRSKVRKCSGHLQYDFVRAVLVRLLGGDFLAPSDGMNTVV